MCTTVHQTLLKQANLKHINQVRAVALNFLVIQHIRDAYLLESFVQVFGCGCYYIKEKSGIGTFAVSNFNHIVDKIIP